MSGHAGAKFVGGPADGELRDLRLGADDKPPTVVTFLASNLSAVDIWRRSGAPVEHVQHRYVRTVSPFDRGPAWVYLYDEPHTAKKETP